MCHIRTKVDDYVVWWVYQILMLAKKISRLLQNLKPYLLLQMISQSCAFHEAAHALYIFICSVGKRNCCHLYFLESIMTVFDQFLVE